MIELKKETNTKIMSGINFNHISKNLHEDEKEALIKLYKHYHRKAFCYKKAFKHYTKINIALNITSIILTTVGTIVGAVTLNPIILGSISGSGVLLQSLLKFKKYDKKTEMCKFAYTNYENILNKIRSYLRGQQYKMTDLNAELVWVDDIVVDLCPIVSKYEQTYEKKYK